MKNRSFFWPFVLIATGVIWILVNLNVVEATNLWALYHLLPYLLLLLGLGLIVRSLWPVTGRIVSALVVIAALLAIVFAGRFGWNASPEWGCGADHFPFIRCSLNLDLRGGVPGSGVIRSEARQLPGFTGLSIDYPVEIVVRQGPSQSVTVEADDNLLPQLELRVSGGTLYIENNVPEWNRRVNPTRAVRIDITVSSLDRVDFPGAGSLLVENFETDQMSIFASGVGEVVFHGLNAGHLEISLSGAGNIEADGTAESLDLDISGVGGFSGEDLTIQSAQVDISGAGSASLWVVQHLEVEISGVGSVSYYGSPSVERSVSGLGSVDPLGDR